MVKQESEIHGRKVDIAEIMQDFQIIQDLADKIAAHLWNIFKSRGVSDIN